MAVTAIEEEVIALPELSHSRSRSPRHSATEILDVPPRAQSVSHQLAPVDGGAAAWRALIAAFVFEALLWGFPLCFGVFQEYYTSLPQYASKESSIALIGTLSQGLPFVSGPLMAIVTKRFAKYRRIMLITSWALCVLSLFLGSLTEQLGLLIATQGVMYGIGFTVMYWPIASIVNEWWVVRKGFAFGMIASAAGVGGAVLPFMFQALLRRYGYKTTLRGTAIALLVVTGPIVPLFKPRLPASDQAVIAKMDWSFTRKPLFWIYFFGLTIMGIGFFFPPLYLPTYAVETGLSATLGALLLALMAISQFVGQMAFGYWSDKAKPHTLAALCAIATSLSAAFLWGMGKSLPPLVVFSIIYGFFGYGFIATRFAMAKAVGSDQASVFAAQAITALAIGVGLLFVGPVSKRLIAEEVLVHQYGLGKYKSVVIFTSSCTASSAGIMALAYFL